MHRQTQVCGLLFLYVLDTQYNEIHSTNSHMEASIIILQVQGYNIHIGIRIYIYIYIGIYIGIYSCNTFSTALLECYHSQ